MLSVCLISHLSDQDSQEALMYNDNEENLPQRALTPPFDSPVLTTQLESNGGGGVVNSVSSRLCVLSQHWDGFLSLVSLKNFHFLSRSRCALKPPPSVTQHEAGCAGVGGVQVGEEQRWWITQQQITAARWQTTLIFWKWCRNLRGSDVSHFGGKRCLCRLRMWFDSIFSDVFIVFRDYVSWECV